MHGSNGIKRVPSQNSDINQKSGALRSQDRVNINSHSKKTTPERVSRQKSTGSLQPGARGAVNSTAAGAPTNNSNAINNPSSKTASKFLQKPQQPGQGKPHQSANAQQVSGGDSARQQIVAKQQKMLRQQVFKSTDFAQFQQFQQPNGVAVQNFTGGNLNAHKAQQHTLHARSKQLL